MEKNNKNKEVKLTGKKSDMNKALRAQKIRRQRKKNKRICNTTSNSINRCRRIHFK